MERVKKVEIHKVLVTSILGAYFLIQGCGGSTFSGGGGQSASDRRITTELPPTIKEILKYKLTAKFSYNYDGQTYLLTGDFLPTAPNKVGANDSAVDFALVPGSLKAESGKDFPADLGDKLFKATISAIVSKTTTDKPWNVSLKVLTSDLKIGEKNIGSKNLDLKSSASEPSWAEKSTEVASVDQSSDSSANCKINNSGNPISGYFTVVTTPAPCDFKLPVVKVGMGTRLGEVEIGTYWQLFSSAQVAHDFSVVEESKIPKVANNPSQSISIDNGFILVEPSGKTYLLVDAGNARKAASNHKSAQSIAQTVLAQKFPGVAFQGLLKPVAGTKGKNYSDSTVFQKGSVIALYDDTPDMGGTVDVSALTEALRTSGLSLDWSAQLVKK